MLHLSELGVSLNTARNHLQSLRRFYDFLNLGGLVNYVAPRLMSIRQTVHKIPSHLSEEEMRRLIGAAETLREKALVEFFYGTGCRNSEVRNLRIQDVDLKARNARITGKFGKTRIVLLTKSAADALRNYLGDRKIGYVFQQDYRLQKGTLTNANGVWIARWVDYENTTPGYTYTCKYLGSAARISPERAKAKFDELTREVCLARPKRNAPLSPMTLLNIIRRLGHRAGLARTTVHMIRHSFTTHLYEHGADLMALQTLLGHATIQATANYARTSPFKLADTFERCHPLGVLHVKATKN